MPPKIEELKKMIRPSPGLSLMARRTFAQKAGTSCHEMAGSMVGRSDVRQREDATDPRTIDPPPQGVALGRRRPSAVA